MRYILLFQTVIVVLFLIPSAAMSSDFQSASSLPPAVSGNYSYINHGLTISLERSRTLVAIRSHDADLSSAPLHAQLNRSRLSNLKEARDKGLAIVETPDAGALLQGGGNRLNMAGLTEATGVIIGTTTTSASSAQPVWTTAAPSGRTR